MKKLTKSAMLVSIIILISKGLGFLREIILAYKYGTNYLVDAYIIAINFPTLLFMIFAGGVSQAYIPIHSRLPNDEKNIFFNNVATVSVFISMLIGGVCFIFSNEIARVLSPGFTVPVIEISSLFIRNIVWIFPFAVAFDLLCAQEYVYEKFVFPSILNYILCNIIIIISIVISTESTALIMIHGFVLATVLNFIILFAYCQYKKDISYHLSFDVGNKYLQKILKAAIPLGASLLLNELNGVVDRAFASFAGTGITSAMNYSNKIQTLFLTLTTSVFLTICFPRINAYYTNNQKEKASYYIYNAMLICFLFSVPFMLALIIFPDKITLLLFQRGAFNVESTLLTASCLRYYALGILAYSIVAVETKILLANLKNKEIFHSTLVCFFLNIILNIVLYKAMGYVGLPLATSLIGWLLAFMLYRYIRNVGIAIISQSICIELLKISIISFIAIVIGSLFDNYVLMSDYIVKLVLLFVLMVAVYICLGFVMNISIFYWIFLHIRGNYKKGE